MTLTIPTPLAVAANRKARIERPEPTIRMAYTTTTGDKPRVSVRDRRAAHFALVEALEMQDAPIDWDATVTQMRANRARANALWTIVEDFERLTGEILAVRGPLTHEEGCDTCLFDY